MTPTRLAFTAIFLFSLMLGACASFETVETGHVAEGTRLGKCIGTTLDAGFHVVSPLNDWAHFDTMKRTSLFTVKVPAADQQKATMDISVQFSILASAVPTLRCETGAEDKALSVHFDPIVRGALRDAGRSTPKVEMFYDEAKITAYRDEALSIIQTQLGPKGFTITDVIVRDVDLPEVIKTAIVEKKKREQEVEKEKAELERVTLVAQQEVRQAQAGLDATKLNSQGVKISADAKAYEIDRIQTQLAKSANYVDYIKAVGWKGVLPLYVGGGDVVPFMNIGGKR